MAGLIVFKPRLELIFANLLNEKLLELARFLNHIHFQTEQFINLVNQIVIINDFNNSLALNNEVEIGQAIN